jgi:hypothetical protein
MFFRGAKDTLLWEMLPVRMETPTPPATECVKRAVRGPLLPYDQRCAALTKSGHRCRGKTIEGSDYCIFHDPQSARMMREKRTCQAGARRRRLSHIPDGYLRKLTSRAAVGQAMDRLYREVCLGIITPEMGNVLFNILTRLLDSGLCDQGNKAVTGRARADRLRPRLRDLLTQAEKTAWRKAVADAPESPPDDTQLILPFPRMVIRSTG